MGDPQLLHTRVERAGLQIQPRGSPVRTLNPPRRALKRFKDVLPLEFGPSSLFPQIVRAELGSLLRVYGSSTAAN
jgi:hypothetical protein